MPRTFFAWLPSPSQHLLFGVLAVLAYVLTTRLRREQRAPTTALAWVMGLALLPYFVLPAYLLFGQRKLRPAGSSRSPRPRGPRHLQHWAAELLDSFGLASPSHCAVRLHADGAGAREALWQVIDSARERLDVCTFIIGDDALGRDVVDRLAARAREGIAVRVLLDGFGALKLPRRHFDLLRGAGGEVAVFRPFFSLRRHGPRNLRNHRKLTIADDRWLWSGGRNLAGEYFCGTEAEPVAWPDLSFDIRGDAASAAARQFDHDWASVRGRKPRSVKSVEHDGDDGALVQFLPSGPDQAEDTAHALLIDACFRAEQRILAVSPYFVPSDGLRDALRLAARRGVQITIALPQRSNHRFADFVRARAMRELSRAGVSFRLLPQMTHAKAVVIDQQLALCGSINLDLRSLLLNHEAAVVFYGEAEIDWLAQWIERTASSGDLYRARAPGFGRDIAEGLLLTLAFQL
ncbi:MAG: phospholipase D-like domain-containing protein [Variovorax sp.]